MHKTATTDFGYATDEYFVSGTANGQPYKTRILVYRPTNPKTFRGTVVVEWLNVSGGVDAAPDWVQGHVELLREGVAWVGVSAQIVGVDRTGQAETLTRFGELRSEAGSPRAAIAVWRQALRILEELSHPDADRVRDKLNRASMPVSHTSAAPARIGSRRTPSGESPSMLRESQAIQTVSGGWST